MNIKYVWCNFLCLIGALKRYSGQDWNRRSINLSPNTVLGDAIRETTLEDIITPYFYIKLGIAVYVEHTLDLDYFYKLNKKTGKKTIVYVMRNMDEKEYNIVGYPEKAYYIDKDISIPLNRRSRIYPLTTYRNFVSERHWYDLTPILCKSTSRKFEFENNDQMRIEIKHLIKDIQETMEHYYDSDEVFLENMMCDNRVGRV